MTASMNENITGVRVVALRREEQNLSDFKVLSTDMFRSSYRAAWLSALFLPPSRPSAPYPWASYSGAAVYR